MADQRKGTAVTVPHLAESLVSATVGKWLCKPGDKIEQYDAICELLTDKVNTEMPSPIGGVMREIVVPEGVTAAVGEVLCYIEEEGASAAASPAPSHEGAAGGASVSRSASMGTSQSHADAGGRFSPAVLKLAAEHGVKLDLVPGTGMGGRITRKDVEAFIAEGRHLIAPSAAAGSTAAEISSAAKVQVRSTGLHLSENPPLPNIEVEGQRLEGRGEYLIDVTPIRNAIATRMRQSVAEIPHAWTMIEADVTNLVMLRNRLKDEFARQEGLKLTYLPFVVKAIVSAIKDYPIMNSVWAVNKIIVKRDINLCIAVGTEDFVVTPVIKKADQKNIAGLAREIDELTTKARAGKLSLSDLEGGTFTVNNTGSFGSISSYPIINYPQAAIITCESIVKKPVVIQDMIAVRSMVNLCLSLDHRILDGVICGRFLQRVKENLESYTQDTKLY
jgi:2-oxoisovalerate dehydrogenase E2 component (dihydrolipoyl transacylase)